MVDSVIEEDNMKWDTWVSRFAKVRKVGEMTPMRTTTLPIVSITIFAMRAVGF